MTDDLGPVGRARAENVKNDPSADILNGVFECLAGVSGDGPELIGGATTRITAKIDVCISSFRRHPDMFSFNDSIVQRVLDNINALGDT